MSRLPAETELVPYAPGYPPGRRWLVLAPHPDDEVFGMGATLAQASRRGIEPTMVVVTDGAAQGSAAQREQEALAAARELGLGEPRFWRFADLSLDPSDRRLQAKLVEALADVAPEVVFVPSPVELHPDHRALALALQRVLRRRSLCGVRRRPPAWVAAYEVGSVLLPNLLVAADAGWEAKRRAAACYASQLEFRPYDAAMEALGTWRRLTLDGCERAEAFHLLPVAAVVRRSARGWAVQMGAPAGVVGIRG
jgi:LmbE family N-acetylglucosaminyl deacetylase